MRPGGRSIPWPPEDDRLADGTKRALALAQDEAARLGHNHVGPLHLLMGLVPESEGVAAETLAALGVTLDRARQGLATTMGRSEGGIDAADITLVPRAQRVIEMAMYESRRLGRATTATEHLLLALLYEKETLSMRLLDALGVDAEEVRVRTLSQLAVPPSYRAAEHADLTEGPYERFDEESRQVLAFARDEATRLGHGWIGGEHVLLGLARAAANATSDGAFREAIAHLGITVDRLREEVVKIQPPRQAPASTAPMKLTGDTKLVIELAIAEAGPGNVVRPRHLLAALGASGDSLAAYVLARFGAKPADVRRAADMGEPPAE